MLVVHFATQAIRYGYPISRNISWHRQCSARMRRTYTRHSTHLCKPMPIECRYSTWLTRRSFSAYVWRAPREEFFNWYWQIDEPNSICWRLELVLGDFEWRSTEFFCSVYSVDLFDEHTCLITRVSKGNDTCDHVRRFLLRSMIQGPFIRIIRIINDEFYSYSVNRRRSNIDHVYCLYWTKFG